MSDGTAEVPSGTPAEGGQGTQAVLGAPEVKNGADGAQTPPVLKAGEQAPAVDAQKPPDAKPADEAAKKTAEDAKALEAKKAEEAKAAAEKEWAEFKPKAADGLALDEAALKDFLPLAKEAGLSPAQAQKLIDFDAKRAQAKEQSLVTERNGWLASTAKDPDIVGADGKGLDQAVRVANKAFERFATPELRQFLAATGFDAHPGLFKAFFKVGQALKDDSVAGTTGAAAGVPNQQAMLDQMFPSMKRS